MVQAVASDQFAQVPAKIQDIRTRVNQQAEAIVAAAKQEIATLMTELTNAIQAEVGGITANLSPSNGAQAVATTPSTGTPKKRGRPKKAAAPGEAAPKGKPGRKPKAGGESHATKVFRILDKGKWPEVKGLPKGTPGLTFPQLFMTYGNAMGITRQQCHVAVSDLKRREKIVANDQKQLCVVAGATID